MYHNKCCKDFFSTKRSTGDIRGRPSDDYVSDAMDDIYSFLDSGDECQYSLNEVMEAYHTILSCKKPPAICEMRSFIPSRYG